MSQANRPDTTIPTRRALLAGAPAAAAAALAAGGAVNILATATARPSSVDPVFDAIRRERDAYAAYCASREYCRKVAKELDPVCERRHGTPEWEAYKTIEAAQTEAFSGWCDAQIDFLETQPTTLPGLIAYLDHVDAFDSGLEDDEWAGTALPTLPAAVRSLIDGGAQSLKGLHKA